MCGRYSITLSKEEISEEFNLEWEDNSFIPKFNAAPSQMLPVIINRESSKICMLKWGLIPYWSKDPSIANKLINARAETITEKPSFKTPFKKSRCLVIADSYYEWKKTDSGKEPYRITLKTQKPFSIAGIWDTWKDENGNLIRTFSIITVEANPFLSEIHNRMPAVISPENRHVWLDNKIPSDEALLMLNPYPEEFFTAYGVSKLVNSPFNDSPELIKPV